MSKRLLYIEDDEIDVLTLKRVLNSFDTVLLEVCSSFSDVKNIALEEYDYIISDCNLPDADFITLQKYLPKSKTKYVSGNELENENCWLKPITKQNIEALLNSRQSINLKYIKDLADGDKEFEREMIETALDVLPDRLKQIKDAVTNLEELKKAAHKAKSSYRVCGIDNSYLIELEDLSETTFKNVNSIESTVILIENQIVTAIAEFKELL